MQTDFQPKDNSRSIPSPHALVHRQLRWMVAMCLLSVLVYAPCRAQSNWGIMLDTPDVSGSPGNMLTYTGTISNNTGSDLLLLGLNLTPSDGYVDSNFAVQFANDFNTEMAINLYTIPSAGYQGALFEVDVLPTATIGSVLYGTFELSVDAPGTPITITALFSTTVVAPPIATVPEPGACVVLGSLSLIAAGFMRRHRVS